MKNDANIRNFIEISGNLHGKSRKLRGKSRNFRGMNSSTYCRMTHFSGRFRSFSGHFRRKMENIGDIFPFSFRFYSFSFLIFKLYYSFCTGIYSINCSYEENYSNFSHHFYGYWR